ncbi:hypothetical protein A3D70_01305 [Candidatus Adlerbacteria bacterium RIFCSPHIGHO2_02_FULL_54_18]|uniref:ATP-cone domain-containing protein n=2 Tax=Candidatus Adleribacteriota TaxID=1752736 RepID=A0A1F4Y1X9_9BACT|nr:MAG: hypothetical protein A2949_01870 [Candidatus Adlerbacteria bacterium RIFCSPLOWO2_01_FULL_54_21b]OGC87848.1 MAG: hypothetical protein A3D70_01305 [Candidatus Adlerbacteria bacterium RIFCSPHIGHO2_02_FULL_54_18]
MAVEVTKADGTTEAFNPEKLVASLVRAGAEHGTARDITAQIEHTLYRGVTTQEIYRHAFARLREVRRGAAARYSLKRALLEFGPSGFPFEAYMAELFRAEGFTAKIDQIMQGACVEHEVDVVLKKDGVTTCVEAKFHNAAGFKTDLKTVLYVKARIDDLGDCKGLVVTNTKFTSKAVEYAACVGLELLSWEEPNGKTLQQRIDAVGLYPITALTTLSRREKMALLSQKKVLCSDLTKDTQALAVAGLGGSKADRVLEEVGSLCVPVKHIE